MRIEPWPSSKNPQGMVVHPGRGESAGARSLMPSKARFAGPCPTREGRSRPGIVHRLDKWTSGLILVAKTNEAHHRLSRSFEKHEVRKSYLSPRTRTGSPGQTGTDRPQHRPSSQSAEPEWLSGQVVGERLVSDYRVLEQSAYVFAARGEDSHRDGRIRSVCILNAIGHPVVGDTVYGEKRHQCLSFESGDAVERHFLHASELEFPTPHDGERRWRFDSPLASRT